MSKINEFLCQHRLTIAENPCVSPDFCLDFASLRSHVERGQGITEHAQSSFAIAAGTLTLLEDELGDHD